MDSRKKHRILGILVVAGLIVITLPLLQHHKEVAPDPVAVAKAPEFPDQSMQVTTSNPMPVAPVTPVAANDVKQQPDEAINTVIAPAISTATPPLIANPALNANVNANMKPDAMDEEASPAPQTVQNAVTAEPEIKPVIKKKIAPKVKSQQVSRTSFVRTPLDDNGLLKLHEAAWVIQVGSYKNKAHALRVVNHLRANGYRAFIQQVTTSFGKDTQVFIGPEAKQTSARALASQLERDMHIKDAMVISYKPLSL